MPPSIEARTKYPDCVFQVAIANGASFVIIRHKRTAHSKVTVDYLGVYIESDEGLSGLAHGLLGKTTLH